MIGLWLLVFGGMLAFFIWFGGAFYLIIRADGWKKLAAGLVMLCAGAATIITLIGEYGPGRL